MVPKARAGSGIRIKSERMSNMKKTEFNFDSREAIFSRLGGGQIELLVIGGGITGASVFRDAVLRGIKTALVESNDFASGTSSRSTKLVHGGLRHLKRWISP